MYVKHSAQCPARSKYPVNVGWIHEQQPAQRPALSDGPSAPASLASLDSKEVDHCLGDRDVFLFPSQGGTQWQIKRQREAMGQAERTLHSAINLPLR